MNWRDVVKTLVGFALGTLLSLGTVTSASAAGTNVAAPAQVPDAGIEVIVVTAKRPAAQPIDTAQPIDEFIVTAKRATKARGSDTACDGDRDAEVGVRGCRAAGNPVVTAALLRHAWPGAARHRARPHSLPLPVSRAERSRGLAPPAARSGTQDATRPAARVARRSSRYAPADCRRST